jgi:integral membrane protein (TIGR01906 family)
MTNVPLSPAERFASVTVAIATAVVIAAVAIVPFLTPAWVSFEQGRTGAAALTGYSNADLDTATGAILHDLVLGPPTFAVAVNGQQVLTERERAHMRDVRGVFGGFAVVAIISLVVVVAGYAGAKRLGHPERAWRAVRLGARGLAVGVVVAGVVALVAFDTAFEIFHRLLFASGSYTFDEGTERLVQLFPFRFWSETTMAVGALIVVLALVVSAVAGRRARPAAHATSTAPPTDTTDGFAAQPGAAR